MRPFQPAHAACSSQLNIKTFSSIRVSRLPALQHTPTGRPQMTDMGSQTIRRGKIIAAMATEPRRIRMTGALLLRRAHVLPLRVCVRTADTRYKCQRNND